MFTNHTQSGFLILRGYPILALLALVACGGGEGDGSHNGDTNPPPASNQPSIELNVPSEVFRGDPINPNTTALYVDGDTGSDNATGEINNPLATLPEAISLAENQSGPVEIYVTRRAGDEGYSLSQFDSQRRRSFPVTIPAGVSIYGGYDSAWSRARGSRSRINGTTTVLTIEEVTGQMAVSGLEITTPEVLMGIGGLLSDTTGIHVEGGTGTLGIFDCKVGASNTLLGSSYGIRVNDIGGLHIDDSNISSGSAGDGLHGVSPDATGEEGSDGELGGDPSNDEPEVWRGGAPSGLGFSGDPQHATGGRGGEGGKNADNPDGVRGSDGGSGSGRAGIGGSGGRPGSLLRGEDPVAPQPGGNGDDGNDGAMGNGGTGTGSIGGLEIGFVPGRGDDGEMGEAGYGGGGGGGARFLTNIAGGEFLGEPGMGGSGGGSGGGGGPGGGGGRGGFASIAILVAETPAVLIENSVIESADGGYGGDGGNGNQGGSGGRGGAATSSNVGGLGGARGGDGGDGGHGAGGAGGAGGPSFGILMGERTRPIIRNNIIRTGQGGLGGNSGVPGNSGLNALGEGGVSVGAFISDPLLVPDDTGNSFDIGSGGAAVNSALNGIAAERNY